MSKPLPLPLIAAHAQAWLGTPYIRRSARRGSGSDCAGLIRGIYSELTGINILPPRWRDDWFCGAGDPLAQALQKIAFPCSSSKLKPGMLALWRRDNGRAAHIGILSERGVIHADNYAGVIETALPAPISSLWKLKADIETDVSPENIVLDSCVAVIYPNSFGYHAEIMTDDGRVIARTEIHSEKQELITLLSPIYLHVEVMD